MMVKILEAEARKDVLKVIDEASLPTHSVQSSFHQQEVNSVFDKYNSASMIDPL